MSIANMVEQMMERGVDRDVILLAIRTAEVGLIGRQSADNPVDESAERRRAYDRERQRKLREIRRQSADNPPTVTTALTLTSLSESKELSEVKKEKKVRARKSEKHPLPADFAPKQSHFDAADRLRIPHSAVHDKTEDLRIWAASSGEWKANWDATLHGFLKRDADKLRGTNGQGNVLAAADKLIDRIRQFDQPAPAEQRQLCSGASEITVRPIPEG